MQDKGAGEVHYLVILQPGGMGASLIAVRFEPHLTRQCLVIRYNKDVMVVFMK